MEVAGFLGVGADGVGGREAVGRSVGGTGTTGCGGALGLECLIRGATAPVGMVFQSFLDSARVPDCSRVIAGGVSRENISMYCCAAI